VRSGIQAELKQAEPFSSLEEEALLSLQRTADQLQWRVSELLKWYGVSSTQYNALRILRGAKEHGRSCGEIAERMVNRDPDITRLIDRLERRGLVQRAREKKDRRVVAARITPAGLELLKKLDPPVEDFIRNLLGHLGNQRLKTLVKLLEVARKPTV
jgi:DNA-binding MarR family transcriptional regulator